MLAFASAEELMVQTPSGLDQRQARQDRRRAIGAIFNIAYLLAGKGPSRMDCPWESNPTRPAKLFLLSLSIPMMLKINIAESVHVDKRSPAPSTRGGRGSGGRRT
jgi:hypothetical protein